MPRTELEATLRGVTQDRIQLTGHGVVVRPRAGYRIERVDGGADTTLRIARPGESRVIDAIAQRDDGRVRSLADVLSGARGGPWRIETSLVTCAWPHGFAVVEDPDGVSPFLLVGPNDAMIWVSSPIARARATPIESLADDGQTVRAVAQAGEDARIDLDYEIDDEAWWQRRYVLVWSPEHALVVTAQALRQGEDLARAAVDLVAHSLERAE